MCVGGSGSEGGGQKRSGHLEEQRAWGGREHGNSGRWTKARSGWTRAWRGWCEAENGASLGWDRARPCRKPTKECDLLPESQEEPRKAFKEGSGLEAEGHSRVGIAEGLLATEWRMHWRVLPRGSRSNAG